MIDYETIDLARLLIGEEVPPSRDNPENDSDQLDVLETYLTNYQHLNQASFASALTEYLLTPSDDANEEAFYLAVNWIRQQLETHSRTEVVLNTLSALSNTNLPMFENSAARLNNLIDLAGYIRDESGSMPLTADRQSQIVAGISAQSESLAEAKLAVDAATQTWHFSFYMMADNNLEAAAIDDLFELQSLSESEYVSVSVALDRSPNYDNRLDDWSDTRYGIINEDSRSIDSLVSAGELNLGAGDLLTQFLDWSFANSTNADNQALILWNHGLGYEGIGVDESAGDGALELSEIADAISATALGHIDLLGFDACSMAIVEGVIALAPATDFILASEDLVPLDGWKYENLLSNDDVGLGKVEHAGAMIAQHYSDANPELGYLTTSMLNLDTTEHLLESLTVFTEYFTSAANTDFNLLVSAREAAKFYFDNDSIDLLSVLYHPVLEQLTDSGKRVTSELAAAVENVVSFNIANEEASSGISIYWPETHPGEYYAAQYENTVTEIALGGWSDLLSQYWDVI